MNRYSDILAEYSRIGRLRRMPDGDILAGMIDLSGNDYLGIGAKGRIAELFLKEAGRTSCFSSGASRLLLSAQKPYAALENTLSVLYGKEALVFNSGYHANVGAVSALAVPGTLIVCDKLVHASVIDGITLSRAPFVRFRHNDVASLRKVLEKYSADYECILVIVESVYSMNGDIAPLADITALKKDFPAMMLYVDEAHAFGVRGRMGLGLCEEHGLIGSVDVIVGTFGKACASVGAFVASSAVLKEYLLNSARSFIFSTALPPINIEYTHFVLQKMINMGDQRDYLAFISKRFASGISAITGQPVLSESQIVPLMAGSNERALHLSDVLRKRGRRALPIRRPTVPPGTERLRFSLNALLTESDVDHVLNEIDAVI